MQDQPIELTKSTVLAAMVARLEAKSIRYNPLLLDQYVNMRLPLALAGVRPGMSAKPNTTMTVDTLRNWVRAFIDKYT